MANNIALAEKYKAALDEIYKRASLTVGLEQNAGFVQATDDEKTIKVAKMALQGLGDYSRSNGYVAGDVTLEWESFTLKHDRGRSFQVDAMDDREALHLPTLNLMRMFMQQHVVPEIDAIRFATMADKSGKLEAASFTDAAAALDAWDAAQQYMDEQEVPRENRKAYFSIPLYYLLKKDKVTRERLVPGQATNAHFEMIDDVPITLVPKSRFYTAVELLAGGEGGYKKGATAQEINFQLVHSPAVFTVTKHALPRIFGPEVNQKANATQFDYRIYHDIFVPDNKTDGIYTHTAAKV